MASQFHLFFKRVMYSGRGIAAIHNIILPAPSYVHWHRLHALNARNSQQMAGCMAILLFSGVRVPNTSYIWLGLTTDYVVHSTQCTVSFVYSHDEHGSSIEYALGHPVTTIQEKHCVLTILHMEAGDIGTRFCSTYSAVIIIIIIPFLSETSPCVSQSMFIGTFTEYTVRLQLRFMPV